MENTIFGKTVEELDKMPRVEQVKYLNLVVQDMERLQKSILSRSQRLFENGDINQTEHYRTVSHINRHKNDLKKELSRVDIEEYLGQK
jgi:hypothetical protein